MSKAKILIAEDEKIAAEHLKNLLTKNGYEIVAICDTGKSAISTARQELPDIVLMDIMLQDNISGCDAAKIIYNELNIGIMFLTAYAENDMIELAKDSEPLGYILKPYKEKEILASLEIALHNLKLKKGVKKEIKKEESKDVLDFGDGLKYNFEKEKLYKNSSEVMLTNKNRMFLKVLLQTPGNAVSYKTISTYIWGEDIGVDRIRSLARRVREAIGRKDIIVGVSGIGYKISTDDKEEEQEDI